MRLFCLDDDPTKYSAANDANIVTTKAMIEPASEEDRTVPEESADPDSKVNSGLSNSTTADNPLADDDDDEDDRVLFNADVVCSAHGERHKHYSLLYCVTVLLIFGSYVHYIVIVVYVYNVPTHTHAFNGPLSGTTRVSRYQKGKTNLDFTEARDSEWQWHQLGHMQVCTEFQTDSHASTPPLSFLQARCPSCRPTSSVKALKAMTIMRLLLSNYMVILTHSSGFILFHFYDL